MTEKVTVYRFHFWDGPRDCWQRSNVWGTAEAITATKIGVIDQTSAIEIDAKHLNDRGMTQSSFNPESVLTGRGFQTRVS